VKYWLVPQFGMHLWQRQPATYNDSAADRMLATRAAQGLGDWSFSIYMVHMPVFFTYRGLAPQLGLWVPNGFFTAGPDYRVGLFAACVFLVVTLSAAALCYRWLEVPARNYLNGRRRAGSGTATSCVG